MCVVLVFFSFFVSFWGGWFFFLLYCKYFRGSEFKTVRINGLNTKHKCLIPVIHVLEFLQVGVHMDIVLRPSSFL